MRLLVIRASAFGDVILTLPVLKGMAHKYPGVEIILLTRKNFQPVFMSQQSLKFFFPDFKARHAGLRGILRLYKDLSEAGPFDHVIDLHDVLRSKILRTLFRIKGTPVSVINKGRKEKRVLVKGDIKKKLKHSVERYRDAFTDAGFHPEIYDTPWIIPSASLIEEAVKKTEFKERLNIGVAPYAKHELKVWPEDYMISLLRLISEKYHPAFWLFGGTDEFSRLESLAQKIPDTSNLAGRFSLDEELALVSRLDFMISMDSANMHIATMAGIKVISIWGATDPLAGFGAWMQSDDFSVRISVNDLTCRPCTIYGKGKCRRGDFACMKWLTPEMVFKRMEDLNLFRSKF